jgi:hypothetical protein
VGFCVASLSSILQSQVRSNGKRSIEQDPPWRGTKQRITAQQQFVQREGGREGGRGVIM